MTRRTPDSMRLKPVIDHAALYLGPLLAVLGIALTYDRLPHLIGNIGAAAAFMASLCALSFLLRRKGWGLRAPDGTPDGVEVSVGVVFILLALASLGTGVMGLSDLAAVLFVRR